MEPGSSLVYSQETAPVVPVSQMNPVHTLPAYHYPPIYVQVNKSEEYDMFPTPQQTRPISTAPKTRNNYMCQNLSLNHKVSNSTYERTNERTNKQT